MTAAALPLTAALADSWVKRLHPAHAKVCTIHELRWALYSGRREELFPKYLEAHRLEARDETGAAGVSIYRERLGYAPRLAQGLIADIIGHLGSTKKTFEWGPLDDGGGGKDELPTGRAKRLYDDVTRDGQDWESFFGCDVLEQILATKGGVLIIDAPPRDARAPALTVEDAQRLSIRPYIKLVDWKDVPDWRWGVRGFEWVKVYETNDTRSLRDTDSTKYTTRRYVTYEFAPDGKACIVSRFDNDGRPEGTPVTLAPIVDTEGAPTLPVIPAIFGRDRKVRPLGRGLLDGLDDIEVDLANQINELRDEVRTIVFGLLAYAGSQGENVEQNLKSNSRFVDLGPEGVLNYVAATGDVITQLLAVIDRTYAAWRAAVRQKPAELMDSTATRSGDSFTSEFAVTWKPLLSGIAQQLDDLESNALYIIGQFWGLPSEQAATLSVKRDKGFRLEDEGSFLARSLKDITQATDAAPAKPLARLVVAMMQAFGSVTEDDDVDALVDEVMQSLTDKRSADVFMNSLRNAGTGAPGDGTGDGTPPVDGGPGAPPAPPGKAKPKPAAAPAP